MKNESLDFVTLYSNVSDLDYNMNCSMADAFFFDLC